MFRMICSVVRVDGPVRAPGQGGGANPLMVKEVRVDHPQIIPVQKNPVATRVGALSINTFLFGILNTLTTLTTQTKPGFPRGNLVRVVRVVSRVMTKLNAVHGGQYHEGWAEK
jgi:hypothetical protein